MSCFEKAECALSPTLGPACAQSTCRCRNHRTATGRLSDMASASNQGFDGASVSLLRVAAESPLWFVLVLLKLLGVAPVPHYVPQRAVQTLYWVRDPREASQLILEAWWELSNASFEEEGERQGLLEPARIRLTDRGTRLQCVRSEVRCRV